MPLGATILRPFFLLVVVVSLSGEIRAQSLQKLIESTRGGASVQKAQPSAAEQKDWASGKVSQLQAMEKELDLQTLREDFRKANLPEARADELVAAMREIVQDYRAAIDTLTAVINKESQRRDPESSGRIPLPKDDSEAGMLRDRLAGLRAQVQTAATQVKLDEEMLTRQQSALNVANQELRRAQEQFDTAKTDAERERAALQLRLAETLQEAASSKTFLMSWRLYADELDLHAGQADVRSIEEALSASGLDSIFNGKRAQVAIQQIEKDKTPVQKQIESAQAARQELDETISRLEQDRQTATSDEDRKRADARLEIAREARDFSNRIAAAGQAWIGALDEALRIWKTTLSVAENPGPAAYAEARKSAEQLLAQSDPWREQIRRYLQNAQGRLEELKSQPRSSDPATSKLEDLRLDLVQQRVDQLREISAFFESLVSHAEQMRVESNQLLKLSSVSERVTQGFAELGNRVESVWAHELFTTEEKITGADGAVVTRTRGIGVGKIILGLIGLAAGLFIAKTLAHIIRNNLGRRFSVETARAAFLEKVLFYFLLVLVVLTTLNWLRIPLTAFAFLGGAIAIGVGFGAQTLMNNFISGLILLAEQRIKVGDLIDVDGNLGHVINLGTRCSRVRKFDGVDVLVPNSYLLEKNVINWTLSDSHHRYDFIVGVAYGTPAELAISTLTGAIDGEPEVLKEPAAAVAFEAFGDNSLIFHVYFWLDIGRSDALKVGTEIRLRIDRLCREAGIQIAFPQRDIHLHTSRPISVRLEDSEKETGRSAV
jgi:potassium-dependent mechanosensitive channel